MRHFAVEGQAVAGPPAHDRDLASGAGRGDEGGGAAVGGCAEKAGGVIKRICVAGRSCCGLSLGEDFLGGSQPVERSGEAGID